MIHTNKIQIFFISTVALLMFVSCVNTPLNIKKQNEDQLSLVKTNDTLYHLQIKTDSTLDQWELPYEVYQFQVGDINNDSSKDMLVGVIKTTRFDSTLAKRLFIFKNYQGLVRPLWLGSRMGQPLHDFRFIKLENKAFVRTIEYEKNGKYLVAEYKWLRFGLEFTRYIDREISLTKAYKVLQN